MIVSAGVLALCSCSLIDLRPIGVDTWPSHPEMVLGGIEEPLRVSFDTGMEEAETEKIFSVGSVFGAVKGDLFWRGRELWFLPLEPWKPGVRYTLTLTGTIRAADGREARIETYIPFYAVHAGEAPYLAAFTPADGTSTGVNAEGGAVLALVFSLPMDRFSTADALSVDGLSEKELVWKNDDTVLEVRPKKNLSPWTVYRWSLGTGALGREGVPLARAETGTFVTDLDRLLPAVSEALPLLRGSGSDYRWVRSGLPLDGGLGSGQGIGLWFNKPMEDSTTSLIRFDPSISGHTEILDSEPASERGTAFVFIPDRDLEPETRYTLIVSADARDKTGLRMGMEYRHSFTVDTPYLKLLSMEPGTVFMPGGFFSAALRFSLPFTDEAKKAAVLALRLEPYFPETLPPLGLRSARWWSADTLVAEWEGLEPGTAAEPHYYRLLLPGGRSGITSGGGSWFKTDEIFFIEGRKDG